jgi:hypothetical protein
MKIPASLLRGAALALAWSIALFGAVTGSRGADAHASAPGAMIADLQLAVNVPATWRPFLEDDIADSLASILRDTFKRRGYKGVIDYVQEDRRAPNPDLPLLTLNLMEWRIGRTGNADCTLTATLRTGGKDHDLGVVTQTQITWVREHGRFGLARRFELADALEDAATGAMRDLYRRVADSGLLPGFTTAKK